MSEVIYPPPAPAPKELTVHSDIVEGLAELLRDSHQKLAHLADLVSQAHATADARTRECASLRVDLAVARARIAILEGKGPK